MNTIIIKLENSPVNIIAGIIWMAYNIIRDLLSIGT